MSTIHETVKQLEVQRACVEKEVAALTTAINALTSLNAGATPAAAARSPSKPAKKGGISAAGRAKIAAAQKERWAKIRAAAN